jgi:xanthine dehydrogenase small subunit
MRLLLNGSAVEDRVSPPDMTILDWLRGPQRLSGTKEGCAEGDCGACTIAIGHAENGRTAWRAVNSCLALLGQVDGAAVLTVEGLAGADGLHPVQKALVDTHGTQCGFCTPGILMSMFVLAQEGGPAGDDAIHETLAGNLCRCTGYRPIVEACRAISGAAAAPVPESPPESAAESEAFLVPRSLADLHACRARHPAAVLWAGGTDLGLLASKERRHFDTIISTAHVAEMGHAGVRDGALEMGGAVTYAAALPLLDRYFPSFGALVRRIGSRQIRNLGTLAGNLGTASPIGDTLPCLLALDARIILSGPGGERRVGIDDYFLGYRRSARREDEIIAAIRLPLLTPDQSFVAYKVSKRFDQDISAVLAAFRFDAGGAVRLAYGGMAAVPKRAAHLESLLSRCHPGRPDEAETAAALTQDFAPLSDHRASSAYRLRVAGNLVARAFAERDGVATRLEAL